MDRFALSGPVCKIQSDVLIEGGRASFRGVAEAAGRHGRLSAAGADAILYFISRASCKTVWTWAGNLSAFASNMLTCHI